MPRPSRFRLRLPGRAAAATGVLAAALVALAGCGRPPGAGAGPGRPAELDAAPARPDLLTHPSPHAVSGASPHAVSSASRRAGPDAAPVATSGPTAGPAPDAAPARAGAAAGAPVHDERTRTLRVPSPLRGLDVAAAPVIVARGDDPVDAVRRALGPIAPSVPPDARVVVKINLGGYDRLKPGRPDDGITGRTTNPALVRALVAELRRRGARDVVLADASSAGARELARALEHSGVGALAAELGAPFVDLNHYGEGDGRPRPWRLELPWAAHLRDVLVVSDDLVGPGRRLYLVDVPKLKTHRFAVASLSIKNLMGAVMVGAPGEPAPERGRWRLHRELAPWMEAWKARRHDDRARYREALRLHSERLADLYGALTPDLVVIEGLPAMQGDGLSRVAPFGDRGIVIASTNGCSADFVAAEFLGLADSDALERELGVRMPPAILEVARRYYGGEAALRRIDVRGDVAWRGEPGRASARLEAMAPFVLH